MYTILFSATADKQFGKLEKPVQERIIRSLERLRINPSPHVTKLVGEIGYRLRVGDYRVILDILNDRLIVLVIKIGHRSTIYQ